MIMGNKKQERSKEKLIEDCRDGQKVKQCDSSEKQNISRVTN